VYHFLGKKKTVQTNPQETDQKMRFKVGTKDFDFIKIVGAGGFSKVMMILTAGVSC
jgi:hypothetical protein